jgi:hypothetical protein
MSRERLLTIAVIVLLVLNVGVVTYLLLGSRPGPPRPELFDVLVRELEMTEDQRERYFQLRDQHRFAMEEYNDEFSRVLETYLLLIKEKDERSPMRDSLQNEIAKIEKQKAEITLDHFQQVRGLCTADQQEKFDRFIPEIAKFMSRPRNSRPPRRN